MQVQPYLYFDGRCDEAIAFYQETLGAKLNMLMRFKDNPDANAQTPPALADRVMHADLTIGESTVLVSDGMDSGVAKFDGVALTLICDDVDDVTRRFEALTAGGAVTVPLTETFFTKRFGMGKDKFGVHWILLTHK